MCVCVPRTYRFPSSLHAINVTVPGSLHALDVAWKHSVTTPFGAVQGCSVLLLLGTSKSAKLRVNVGAEKVDADVSEGMFLLGLLGVGEGMVLLGAQSRRMRGRGNVCLSWPSWSCRSCTLVSS